MNTKDNELEFSARRVELVENRPSVHVVMQINLLCSITLLSACGHADVCVCVCPQSLIKLYG